MKNAQSELDDAMNPIWSPEWLQGSAQESGSPSVPQIVSSTNVFNPYYEATVCVRALTNIYLNHGHLEEESAENLAIRDQFLPELLVAYITALNFYAHAVSRDYLIECMELVAYIADESKGRHIVETLMRTKRMVEFVELVTRVSREMVGANETSQKGGNPKKKVSRKMGLWSVRIQAA